CSAAAVAIHRACRAIQTDEIEMALVGSARVVLSPEPLIALSRMKVLSPVGAVKSFGRDADGYQRAEGAGSLVLKSLRRAEADGDHVYAVIRSTATNFNGRGGMSMAAPNRESHAAVIRECYERAGVDPADVEYIEAQGMGNQVGDIAEWEACNRALERMYQARGRAPAAGACRVSTLKPLIGHMECASALGALFKIVGSLKADRIYGIHGLEEVNPYLDTAGRPCRLLRHSEPWRPDARPRLAGLHSYGSGGSNAHLLIEEYLAPGRADAAPAGAAPREYLFVFSAPDDDRLRETLRQFAAHLARTPGLAPADVAFTLLRGRQRFARRLAFVASSLSRLQAEVEAYLRDEPGAARVGAPGAAATALSRAGQRWLEGDSLDGAEIGLVGRGRRVSLPGYPFRPTPCWPAGAAGADAAPRPPPPANAQTAGPPAGAASVEATITRVLADLLRLEPSAVRTDKDFVEYGLDSITLAWFAAKLAEALPATRLPATTFLEHPTVEALAAHLARDLGAGARAPGFAPPPNGGRAAATPGPPAYGDLQLLNGAGGGGVAAYWFHGALGTVQSFLPLAKELGQDVRFYGVQSRAVRERIEPPADLAALARSYCDLLLEANGNSPFHLGGYSQGGALAVEVARRLRGLGRTVKSVVMIDTPFPPIGSRFSERFNHVLAFANLLQMNGRKVSDEIPELLRKIDGSPDYREEMLASGVAGGLGRDREELARVLRKFYEITRANVRSMEGHAVAPLEPGGGTEFHLFQRGSPGAFFSRALCTLEEARRHNRYFAANDCAGKWREVIPGLTLHPTGAADHFSILEEGGALAQISRTCRRLYAPGPGLGAERMAI
ncbi:MAG TPA: alpha/beta fold hydrolase, partial [Polyangiaceae bacterium]|nr:alpha/beta fold hydrolase [Polyangiaceae bacterium]